MTQPERSVLLLGDAAGYGGAEAVLVALAAEWSPHLPVTAIVPAGNDAFADRLAAAGAAVTRVTGLGRHSSPVAIRQISRLIAAAATRTVVANLTDQGDGGALLLACRRAGIAPTVLLHLWIPGRARWRDAVSVRRLRRAAGIATPSQATADLVAGRRLAATSIRVAPPETPRLDRAAARRRLGLAADARTVGGIGRLVDHKGWDLLAAAAATIRASHPEVRFVVVGDGPERERLAALEGGAAIDFVGAIPDAASLLAAFDVVAIPSRYEGLPLVAIEAARAAVPVVAADATGLREAVGEAGVLVPAERPAELAAALLDLLDDPERARRLGARSRERAAREFSTAGMATRMAAVVGGALDALEGCRT